MATQINSERALSLSPLPAQWPTKPIRSPEPPQPRRPNLPQSRASILTTTAPPLPDAVGDESGRSSPTWYAARMTSLVAGMVRRHVGRPASRLQCQRRRRTGAGRSAARTGSGWTHWHGQEAVAGAGDGVPPPWLRSISSSYSMYSCCCLPPAVSPTCCCRWTPQPSAAAPGEVHLLLLLLPCIPAQIRLFFPMSNAYGVVWILSLWHSWQYVCTNWTCLFLLLLVWI
jgi:hypothetical protein